jgi:thiamine-phosphate pyrophosphorylase
VILCYVTDRKSLAPGYPASAATAAPVAGAALEVPLASLLLRITAAASAGLDWVQLREKGLAARDCAALTAAAVKRCRVAGTKVAVNDRLDVALAEGADAVHLGERSLPAAAVCRSLRDSSASTTHDSPLLIGVSCHSVAYALAAADAGAGYLFFGPVFDTPSKRAFGPAQGIPSLARVCRAVSIPVLAIGGINAENASLCLNAGASGIAAIRLFQESADVSAVVSQLRSAR